MPNIGDIISANNIGRKVTRQKRLFAWSACPDCGKERWVRKYYEGKPSSGRCIACGNKHNRVSKARKMEKHGNWNGGRKLQKGYVYLRLSKDDFFYPLAHKNGYALEHRVIMARHLGRLLSPWEIVHHINGIKDDNRIENLELLPNIRSHLVDMETKRYIKQLEDRIKELEVDKQEALFIIKGTEHTEEFTKEVRPELRDETINVLCGREVTVYWETRAMWQEARGKMGDSDAGELADLLLALFDEEAIRKEVCANCDTPLLREGELYQKLDEAKREERERILLIIQDWDKWVNEEDGEEKWRAKYGCDTTELVKVIEQALKGESK